MRGDHVKKFLKCKRNNLMEVPMEVHCYNEFEWQFKDDLLP